MQLPRGTFREIRKNETIEDILTELERTRFSGICSISSKGGATGNLVLNRGKCILVKYQGISGDAGWDELQQSLSEEVDAALSTLDDAQIQLSLEFNKPSRLVRGGKILPAQTVPAERQAPDHREPLRKPASSHPAPPQPAPAATPVKPAPKPPAPHAAPPLKVHPVTEQRTQAFPAQPPAQTAPQAPSPQVPPAQRTPPQSQDDREKEESSQAQDSGQGSFEKDIDTFDSMDLDNVTDKIRNDCKTMIKQLQLEHLMER